MLIKLDPVEWRYVTLPHPFKYPHFAFILNIISVSVSVSEKELVSDMGL
jgi:hypothetical protein